MFRIKLHRSKADALFSDYVRERAGWACERCFKKFEPYHAQGLDCSHFYGRGNKSTRFDLENAAAMCRGCHQHFTANPELHRHFFLLRLGEKRFDLLTVRFHTPHRVDEKEIALGLKMELDLLRKKGDGDGD